MMKFFRKHQKMILLGMVALMVLFLVPTAFDVGGSGHNPDIGSYVVNGKTCKVSAAEVQDAGQEVAILNSLRSSSPYGARVSQELAPYLGADQSREGGLAWLLWTRLAQAYNVVVTAAERSAGAARKGRDHRPASSARHSTRTT